ncbi:uncharacterized protein LOC100824088 [Brachypodium distachyon]|uniref:uncharacterized protein LOC100824088 n=1 Tax=Brachypodium distachyon TaxID=15368 RepID=UPI0001C7336F|nr:uncharacterized protein LOC100824088 [Brachypodium distachyon]|eukprot:XP_003570775.1 uncharacterized protein LOC100824088 [Brachypodium distachyon]
MADSVSKVLDDDNLLAEIIVRVGFPTTLVRAALVCKRWFRQASDPALLNRFRKLHPRRLLGFYLQLSWNLSVAARFILVLPQPPELGTVIRRKTYQYQLCSSSQIIGCRNGNLLIGVFTGDFALAVHSPLCSDRGLATLPALPTCFIFTLDSFVTFLSKEEGDGLSYFYVAGEPTKDATGSTVHVYVLRNGDGAWREHLTLSTDQQLAHLRSDPRAVLVDDKIYIASGLSDIVVFDLTVPSFSTIHLPHGVEYVTGGTILSRADDASGVYLIHAGKDLLLRIWLHKEGDDWLLVDTICLHEMCANLRMLDCTVEDDPTAIPRISHVGDYAEFVFLEMGRCVLLLDVKCRTLRKLYEMPKDDPFFRGKNYPVEKIGDIHPVMMIWPPKFPVLKDDPARNAM